MKTAIYTRVSTDKQAHDSQLLELRQYCQRRNWQGTVEYADTISGSKFTRQGLDAMLGQVRKGKLARIVVYKLDRLGRSLPHLAQIVSELTAYGTALVCTSQGIDTSDTNPAGRLQLNILAAVAEFEKDIIRERVNAGLTAAKARGAKLGRPATLEHHREAVAALVNQGKGARVISRELGLALSSTCKLIKNIRATASVPLASVQALVAGNNQN